MRGIGTAKIQIHSWILLTKTTRNLAWESSGYVEEERWLYQIQTSKLLIIVKTLIFSIYTVFPCIHLHVKEQDSKNHYLIISYSTRQYKLSLHLPLNYWYIFKKLAHHISHAHLSSVGALFPPVLDSSFAFLHMTLMTAVRVSQYALAHDRTANWFVLHRTIKAKIKMWENL